MTLPPGLIAQPDGGQTLHGAAVQHAPRRRRRTRQSTSPRTSAPTARRWGWRWCSSSKGREGLGATVADLQPRPAARACPPSSASSVLGPPVYINTKVRSDGDYGMAPRLPAEHHRGEAGDGGADDDLGDAGGPKPRHAAGAVRAERRHLPEAGTRRGRSCGCRARARARWRARSSIETWAQPPASASAESDAGDAERLRGTGLLARAIEAQPDHQRRRQPERAALRPAPAAGTKTKTPKASAEADLETRR